MSFWFRKSFKFGPGRVNLSKSGPSLSGGTRGARLSLGARGLNLMAPEPRGSSTGSTWAALRAISVALADRWDLSDKPLTSQYADIIVTAQPTTDQFCQLGFIDLELLSDPIVGHVDVSVRPFRSSNDLSFMNKKSVTIACVARLQLEFRNQSFKLARLHPGMRNLMCLLKMASTVRISSPNACSSRDKLTKS